MAQTHHGPVANCFITLQSANQEWRRRIMKRIIASHHTGAGGGIAVAAAMHTAVISADIDTGGAAALESLAGILAGTQSAAGQCPNLRRIDAMGRCDAAVIYQQGIAAGHQTDAMAMRQCRKPLRQGYFHRLIVHLQIDLRQIASAFGIEADKTDAALMRVSLQLTRQGRKSFQYRLCPMRAGEQDGIKTPEDTLRSKPPGYFAKCGYALVNPGQTRFEAGLAAGNGVVDEQGKTQALYCMQVW